LRDPGEGIEDMVLKWLKTPHDTLASECGRFFITRANPKDLYPKPYALWMGRERVDNYRTSEAAKAAATSIAPTRPDGASSTATNPGVTNEPEV
jgi:hypothetical protein